MGCVYLIEDNENGLYKIGVTRGSAIKRMKQLLTGSAQLLYLKYYFETDYPFKLEKLLHQHYFDKHYNNEWFWLEQLDIDEFVGLCCKYLKILEAIKDNPYF